MLDAELQRFRELHPQCAALHAQARRSLFGGVPMPWMIDRHTEGVSTLGR